MGGSNLVQALYGGRAPDSVAFTDLSGRAVTTAAMRGEIERCAGVLERMGIGAGDRVSCKLSKSREAIVLAHACFQRGAILHPLNTAYTDHETGRLIEDVEPKLLILDPTADLSHRATGAARPRMETAGPGWTGSFGEHFATADPLPDIAEVAPEDTAVILYTSGTTGRPKGACITHGNLAESARSLARVWRIGADDTLLHPLPIFHAHGLLTSINTMLVGGGRLLLLDGFDAAAVAKALPGCTVMMGVPTHYARLLAEPALGEVAGSRFRLAISGSAPLPAEAARRFHERTSRCIVERYGATETAIVTAVPAGETDRSGWVGWALPGVEIRVSSSAGHATSGAAGELETRGHNVFRGYWRRPDADAEAFTDDGWFKTGDVAEIDESGCVRLLGRARDLIITGGLNVYPKEVEDILDQLPQVVKSAVFAAPHPDFGEAVVAAIELNGSGPFDERAAIARLRERLAGFKAPKRILVVDQIPHNAMGKVLKNELRERFAGLFDNP